MRKTLLLLVLALGGCTVGPDYVPPEVDVPTGWRFEADDAQDLTNTTWWKQFEDPVLDDLIDTALENNRDVRIAAARVEEFAAVVGITRSEAFPQLGYGGNASRDQRSLENGLPGGLARTNSLYDATVNFGWELDIWGRIRRATEAARAELLAAEEGRRTVLLTLVSTVATSYIDLLGLDEQLEIARRTLASRGETVQLFELKFEGGLISDLELSQIKSEYEAAAVRIPALEREIALQENAISVLLGQNPGPIPRGLALEQLVLPAVPAGVPSDVLYRRPDIFESEQVLIAANARIGVARAEYFPRISLTGLLGVASDDLTNLARTSAGVWSIGASLTGPIFTGGRLESQVQVTEAVRKQALFGYLSTVQTAFREVDDALLSNLKSHEELEAQDKQIVALTTYSSLARLRYDNGYVSFIEVLDSERRLFDAELVRSRIQADIYASLVSIYKAMGGGWVMQAAAVADVIDFPSESAP